MGHLESISPTNRSRVTNARLQGRVTSRALFAEGDGRSIWGRRYRDLVTLFADDLGGLATMTELKLGLVRRTAALAIECEKLEDRLANGQKVDIDLLARLSGHVRRLSETLGLDRVKRDITPSLADILASHSEAEKPTTPVGARRATCHHRARQKAARDARNGADEACE